jgi:hypothetical protein
MPIALRRKRGKLLRAKWPWARAIIISEKVRNMSAKAYRKLFIDETD